MEAGQTRLCHTSAVIRENLETGGKIRQFTLQSGVLGVWTLGGHLAN